MEHQRSQYSIIPLFHHSNCERSELTCIGFRCRVSGVREVSRKILTPRIKLHGSQCHFHEVGGHSPPYGALKATWRSVGWAAPTMIATGRSRPAAALI